MVWLTLLVVWAAAAIIVAIVWGKVVRWDQDSGDEHSDTGPASTLDTNAEVPSPDGPGRSSHR